MGSPERMAVFAHPRQEGGPGIVVAARYGGSGVGVRATDIPPIRRDLPDELQPRGGLQRGRPPARAGGIEARLFVLLGRTALTVCSRRACRPSSIPGHGALIAKNALAIPKEGRDNGTYTGHDPFLRALWLSTPGTGNIPVSRVGAGGSPVTSRISCSLRVSRDSKASASASSCLRCALSSCLASSWLSPMILRTSASMASAVSSL